MVLTFLNFSVILEPKIFSFLTVRELPLSAVFLFIRAQLKHPLIGVAFLDQADGADYVAVHLLVVGECRFHAVGYLVDQEARELAKEAPQLAEKTLCFVSRELIDVLAVERAGDVGALLIGHVGFYDCLAAAAFYDHFDARRLLSSTHGDILLLYCGFNFIS